MNILVVSCDAGGSEIISAYIKKKLSKNNYLCVVGGPAVSIFKKRGLDKNIIGGFNNNPKGFFEKYNKIDLILAGVGWVSDMSMNFLEEAKKRNIKTAVYLDHWVDYRERFGYPRIDWKKKLPDEIWVGDKAAFKIAKKQFLREKIRLVPNEFFKEIKLVYKKFVAQNKIENKHNILFLSEPISEGGINIFGDKDDSRRDEHYILDKLLAYFSDQKEKRAFIIRFHPSDRHHKYDAILSKYKNNLTILKSENSNLFVDISEADLIIGIETMALAVAVLCGKSKVVSFIPDESIVCPVPFKIIKKIKKVEDLAKIG